MTSHRSYEQRVRDWLVEWDAFLALEAGAEGETGPPPGAVEGPGDPAAPAAGQIRLLPPSLSPDAPRYAAVAEGREDGSFRVFPFGRLGVPAFPGERGLDRPWPLAVICLWNPIRLPAKTLAAGWFVGELTPEERKWLEGGDAEGSAADNANEGPPLRHPLDPRHDYIELEREFSEAVQRAAGGRGGGTICYPEAGAHELPMAAEERERYGDPPEEPS